MKGFSILAGIVAASLLGAVRVPAQNDQYIQVYNLIQEADALDRSIQPDQALSKYIEAQTALQQFQRMYPGWNTNVVQYRLRYLASMIAGLSARAPSASPSPSPRAVVGGTNAPAASLPNPEAMKTLESQVDNLQGQLRQLQADKLLLQAKLKEALAAQPAAIDPRELARAQERIKTLEKENGLLQVSVAQQSAKAVTPAADANAVARLQSQVNVLQADAAAAAAVRAENEILKKQLAATKAAPPAAKSGDLDRQLGEMKRQLAALQSDKEIMSLQNLTLEDRVRQLSAAAMSTNQPGALAVPEESTRVKQLEVERAELQAELASAQKELLDRTGKSAAAQISELTGQVEGLQARLGVFEAKRVPYTKEELALLKKPDAALATAARSTAQRSVTEMPAGAAELVAQARRDFAAQRFEQAEEKYLQVLKQDRNNVYTLANLATIQLQLNRLDDAEKHVQQALALEPDDAYSLMVLGEIKFRQAKYDEALDALSRAAKLDPQNAEIQNYLGVTLSQKGMREPAETALRRAIELNPNYGSAHNNLAVIYLSEKPPLVALARYHYDKALAAGLPHNPELEKMLAQDQKSETSK